MIVNTRKKVLKLLQEKKKDYIQWCQQHQLQMKNNDTYTHAPITLLPSPWSKKVYDETKLLQPVFSNILNNISDADFYFLHSYFCQVEDEKFVIAKTKYRGIEFPSIIQKNNIFGIQFHPEKSRIQGLKILKNFSNL